MMEAELTAEEREMLAAMEAEGRELDELLLTLCGPMEWPLPCEERYFMSGTNQPGEIRALAERGNNIGVAAPEVRKAAEAELVAVAGHLPMVFVDSGAFGEVDFGPEGPTWPVPITHKQWVKRLGLYERLARALGRQLYAVAPDKVASQEGTLERLATYREEVRAIAALGANVIIPVQKGAMTMGEMARKEQEILGLPLEAVVWGIPSRKDATTVEDLRAFCRELAKEGHGLVRIHLLGVGPKSGAKFTERLEAIAEELPEATVYCDSVRITAMVGRFNGPGGGPRKYTLAQDAARAAGAATAFDWKRDGLHLVMNEEDADAEAEARRMGWFDMELELRPGVPRHCEAEAPAAAPDAVAPSSGQSGPALELGYEDLNADERSVLDAVRSSAESTLAGLAAGAFANAPSPEKANSRVRNALRRLVRAGLVAKPGKGRYAPGVEAKRAA